MLSAENTFNVTVRYSTPQQGFNYIRYQIKAEDSAEAKRKAIARAVKIKRSSHHEAEITVA